MYHEDDAVEGLKDKSMSNSRQHGNLAGQKEPNELVLDAGDHDSVSANQKAFKINRRRNLKS